MMNFAALSPQVEKLIRRVAHEVIMPCFQKLTPDQIRYKSPKDGVTDADEKAEELLTQELLRLLPGSVVVGEENCHRDKSCLQHLAAAEWCWLVDPIDGTNNFIRHSDDFGVMVALIHHGQPYAGWIYLPVYDIFIGGPKGGPIKRNGKEIQVIPRPHGDLDQLCCLYRLRDKAIEQKMEYFPVRFDTHCNAFDFTLLISGDADMIVYPGSKPWDVVAGSVLIEALGGKAAKATGQSLEGDVLQETTPFLATRLAEDWQGVSQYLFA